MTNFSAIFGNPITAATALKLQPFTPEQIAGIRVIAAPPPITLYQTELWDGTIIKHGTEEPTFWDDFKLGIGIAGKYVDDGTDNVVSTTVDRIGQVVVPLTDTIGTVLNNASTIALAVAVIGFAILFRR